MSDAFNLDEVTWARLRGLLDVALGLAPEERRRWLDTLPPADAPLRTRIAGLLALNDSGEVDALMGTLPRLETLDFMAPAATPAHQEGEFIGPYKLLRPLGEGGMGSVWLAQRADGLIDRPVALKLPRLMTDRGTLAARMARERRILSALNHENISRLYDAGLTADNQPFLALEYVEGTAIDVFCKARRLGLRERLLLFREVVNAIGYAHGKLVVHRDLKPANVLVTPESRVKLLDFGIGKLLDDGSDEGTELTHFHGRPLTLEFASPEQVRGDAIGTASDIYSLGVILFHLLTETRPYRIRRNSRAEIEEAILHGEPQRPSAVASDPALRSKLRGDLDTIVLKALRKAPEERYATANAFAEDIDRYLSERPVLAQPDSRGYRLGKFVRRNRVAVSVASGVALLVFIGIGTVLWQAHVAIEERRKAEDVQEFITSIFTEANPFERSGAPVSAVTLLERAHERVDRELADRPEQRVKMLSAIGNSLADMHEIEAGGRALTEAVDVAVRTYGPEAPVSLHARADRLELAEFLDEPAKADAELRSLMATLRAHDPGEGLLSQALSLQAVAQYEARDFDHAIESANEAYLMARRDFGPLAKETARAAQLVAQTNEFARRLDVAEKAARAAIAETRASNPSDPDSGDLIEARMILVRVLGAEGKAKESVAEYTSVFESARRHFGESSVEVAFHCMSLAKSLLATGDPRRAESLFAEVIRIYAAKEKLDGKHRAAPDVWHARALLTLRDAGGALAEVTPAIAQLEKGNRPDQPDLIRARVVAALADAYLGRFDDGEAQFAAIPVPTVDAKDSGSVAASHAHGDVREPHNEWQARVLAARAEFARIRNDDVAAVSWARQSLDMAGPAAKLERMSVLPGMGRAQVGLHHLDEAERVLTEALELSEEVQIGDSPERADTWLGLGELAAARGECAKARGYLDRSAKYWESLVPGGNSRNPEATREAAACKARPAIAARETSGYGAHGATQLRELPPGTA